MIHRVRFIINSSIEDYLYHTRQDGSPGCDTSEHPGTGTRARGGNAGVRLATPARRTSPTAHREDHLAIGIGQEGKRAVAQGGEIPLDRPKAGRFEIEQHRTVGAWEPVPGTRASVQRRG
jgi:hypothetical protein